MTNPDEATKTNHAGSPPTPASSDVENPTSATKAVSHSHMTNPDEATKTNHAGSPPTPASATEAVSAITRRGKRENLLNKVSLILRVLAFVFSFLSFIIMVSNKHGDQTNFDLYPEYKYLLAIAIISALYTGVQAWRHVFAILKSKQIFEPRISALLDFIGDQMAAYLLISSTSAAIPLTCSMREWQYEIFTDYDPRNIIFTDSSAAAISMSAFAFLSLALTAMISGYKLSTQSYI